MCLEMNELDLNSKISVIGDVRNKEAMQNVFQNMNLKLFSCSRIQACPADGRKSISSYFDQHRRD
jgi:hypothetical protein